MFRLGMDGMGAVELYVRYGKRATPFIKELRHPCRGTLVACYREWGRDDVWLAEHPFDADAARSRSAPPWAILPAPRQMVCLHRTRARLPKVMDQAGRMSRRGCFRRERSPARAS